MIFLLFLVAQTLAYSCTKSGKLYPPALVYGAPTYYPLGWDEVKPAPDLDAGSECSWTVVIPKDMYAMLIIDARMTDKQSWISLLDSTGQVQSTQVEVMVPYFFTNPKFNIHVKTNGISTFAFKLTWYFLPTHSIQYQVATTDLLIKNTSELTASTKFISTNKISLVGIQADYYRIDALRSVLIFDGPSEKDLCLGNLAQVVISQNQLISSGNSLTLVNLDRAVSHMDQVVVQDASNTQSFISYQGLACYQNECPVENSELKSTDLSAMISVSDLADSFIASNINPQSSIDVYYGTINPENFVTTINSTTWNQLPMTFGKSKIRQYVFHNGIEDAMIIRS